MSKVVSYMVAKGPNIGDLAKIVNQQIDLGWQPQGGISISRTGTVVEYAQALVKIEQEEK